MPWDSIPLEIKLCHDKMYDFFFELYKCNGLYKTQVAPKITVPQQKFWGPPNPQLNISPSQLKILHARNPIVNVGL